MVGSCTQCGKEIHRKPSVFRRYSTTFCSPECQNQYKSIAMSGPGNHQWGLKGELNSSWKGDIKESVYKYLLIRMPQHPFRNVDDFVFLHRAIYEEALRQCDPESELLVEVDGFDEKYLDPDCIIHHMDENRWNNHISNLVHLTLGDHVRYHNRFLQDQYIRDIDTGRFVAKAQKHSILSQPSLFKKYTLDAGLDIVSAERQRVDPFNRTKVKTGLHVQVPKGCVGLVWSRSGLSVTHGIEVGAGCIDSSFRGELEVVLYNFSKVPFIINIGDRIAQFLTVPVFLFPYSEVGKLDETERGEGGFGHTGT